MIGVQSEFFAINNTFSADHIFRVLFSISACTIVRFSLLAKNLMFYSLIFVYIYSIRCSVCFSAFEFDMRLQIPQLSETFQVILTNATGKAQLGTDTEALLIVRNHNFAIYFNGKFISFLCLHHIFAVGLYFNFMIPLLHYFHGEFPFALFKFMRCYLRQKSVL